MITEGIIRLFVGLVRGVIALLPDGSAPGWLDNGSGALAQVWAVGAGMGAWIPWATVSQVFAAVMASVVIGFTIKGIRIVASFFTAGGGSAA